MSEEKRYICKVQIILWVNVNSVSYSSFLEIRSLQSVIHVYFIKVCFSGVCFLGEKLKMSSQMKTNSIFDLR